MVLAEAAGQRLAQLGKLAAHPALGEVGQDLRVVLAIDQGLERGAAGNVHEIGDDGGQLDAGVLQELLQSLHDLSSLMGQLGARSRKVPQLADRLRRDERGLKFPPRTGQRVFTLPGRGSA
ncbi:hypothetical protein [Streptomyces mirabilis]|uniref:hypothetical protein n=1 Tax=Streptomyces mirabilis TaxID=68239 RepID=UPI003D9E06F1